MLKEIDNYYQTFKYMKKSQIAHLLKNRLTRRKKAVTDASAPKCRMLSLWMEKLDECEDYLGRFCLEEIMAGNVTLLHACGKPCGKNWENPARSHLWNFNLHYLEYLIPLAAAYRKKIDARYYEAFRNYCRRWIADNREGSGDGWHPYTISLRIANLFICLAGFGGAAQKDAAFFQELNNSLYAQYLHLQKRMERHLLANHYFENLKAVTLGALYFQEQKAYHRYKKKLLGEIREQILPDGVHYERSLMYHKVILEDIMRVAKAVRFIDPSFYKELYPTVRQMADAGWALEAGMGRTLLFNDAGDNVAKPWIGCLLEALEEEFQICPDKDQSKAFPDAGYYCLESRGMKLVMDAGRIAPDYMPGHGHCDALSFELAWHGKPVFVNAGTGQYQGPLRSYFRSTAAHNTAVIDGEEQSCCWGEHRLGRRIRKISGSCKEGLVKGSLASCSGKRHSRIIRLTSPNTVEIRDQAKGRASAFLHLAPEYEYVVQSGKTLVKRRGEGRETICEIRSGKADRLLIHRQGAICSYAPEFGKIEQTQVLEASWDADGGWHRIQLRFLELDGKGQ